MTQPGNQTGQDAPLRENAGKRPYVRPVFRYERVFETMALSCGKIDTTQAQCRILLKLS
jgi:hypothetical protein